MQTQESRQARERSELEEENDKEEKKSENENEEQVLERFLLFLILATVFDANRTR